MSWLISLSTTKRDFPMGFPAAVLLQQPGAGFDTQIETLEWDRFPIKAMAKAGWNPAVRNLAARSEELARDLINQAGDPAVACAALYRNSHQARANATTDPFALKAWCRTVMGDANRERPPSRIGQRPSRWSFFVSPLSSVGWRRGLTVTRYVRFRTSVETLHRSYVSRDVP